MKRRKRLPIGKSTFRDIRNQEQDFVYVDKTEMAYNLIDNGFYYFLARPRRFGKSLFLDTLSELFKANKALFEGLYVYDKWDWSEPYPVIKIDFTTGNFSSKELIENTITACLQENAEQLGVEYQTYNSSNFGLSLRNLIQAINKKYKMQVVILIDEYDKPIIDNILEVNKTVACEARKILRDFYSGIKASDQYLRFAFVTGVSKFSKLNLFSGFNNLQDITLHRDYTTITGYTHSDLKNYFADFTQDTDLEEVKRWYNGYNYLGEPIYNPYDILLFLSNGCEFENYWWETGNPQFLIEKLKEQPRFLPELENQLVSKENLNAFDVEHIDLTALLWQTGYLTFAERETLMGVTQYRMKVPNLEIQHSLNTLFLDYLTKLGSEKNAKQQSIVKSLLNKDLQAFQENLKALFAAIPHENYTNNPISKYEGYYASVTFAFLSSLGFSVIPEDTTNHGRIDMTMIGTDSIFILEFKVDMPAEAALHQIKTKRYFEKYTAQNKQIYLMGIQFDSTVRNIVEFEYEVLEEY